MPEKWGWCNVRNVIVCCYQVTTRQWQKRGEAGIGHVQPHCGCAGITPGVCLHRFFDHRFSQCKNPTGSRQQVPVSYFLQSLRFISR